MPVERSGVTTEQLASPAAAARQLRIVVVDGPDHGLSLLLAPGTYLVGTSRSCALRLTDGAVSNRHLELIVDGERGGVVVRDLESTNGSWFGGARFTVLEVDRAATLTIGKTELRIEAIDSALVLPPSSRTSFGGLIGSSESMRRLFALLERVAGSESSVLIEGETGTGKELVARALHDHSPRRDGSYVVCDLGSVGSTVSDSELFGHVKGAFTGAHRDRIGAFEAAHRGTIFLDEVSELPLELQPKLLRALESREVRRVGDVDYRTIDVRVIAATNRDLDAEVKAGRFREDLYHRLGVIVARVPALREHASDIPELVDHFLGASARRPDAETLVTLTAYDWPGNVRELRNVIERAVALDVALSPALVGVGGTIARTPVDPSLPFREAKTRLVEAWERDYVTALLASCKYNVSLAARRAGMDRAYLHRLVKKHGVT
jgi:two-component system, NtrC family, nitrogen regulation response regulator GlnG